ncbi:MAG: hypothetical protein H0Z29_00260 [Candidatus Marinimicrobia bacterium]|nr:hypothetical protein [Candidatus Neomarinimicrobiota bacterium]
MKWHALVFLIFIIFCISNCSKISYSEAEFNLKPKAIGEQVLVFRYGKGSIYSEMENSAVIFTIYKKIIDSKMILHVVFVNTGYDMVNIFPENIKVIGYDSLKSKKIFEILSTDECIENIKCDKILNILYKFYLEFGNPNFVNTILEEDIKINTGLGSKFKGQFSRRKDLLEEGFTGTFSIEKFDYNPWKYKRMWSNVKELEEEARYEYLDQFLFTSNTLLEYSYINGCILVKVDYNYLSKLSITIPIGNEKHTFIYE